MKKVLGRHYKHIDNGGPVFEVIQHGEPTDEENYTELKITTSYHGYPALETSLQIQHMGHEWLTKVGAMFIQAAAEMKKQEDQLKELKLNES